LVLFESTRPPEVVLDELDRRAAERVDVGVMDAWHGVLEFLIVFKVEEVEEVEVSSSEHHVLLEPLGQPLP
jgi:hypothetical protein